MNSLEVPLQAVLDALKFIDIATRSSDEYRVGEELF